MRLQNKPPLTSPQYFLLILLMIFGLVGTASAQTASLKSIVDDDNRTDMFSKAIEEAELDWLDTRGTYTLLVPTDDAFNTLPEDALDNLFDDQIELKKFVFYHMVLGDRSVDELTEKELIKPRVGKKFAFDSDWVIDGDIAAENGTIHLIDTVLLPPNSALAEDVAASSPTTSNETETTTEIANTTDSSNETASTTTETSPSETVGIPTSAVTAVYTMTDPTDNPAYVAGYRDYFQGVNDYTGTCKGMTWVTLQVEKEHTRFGSDGFTNPWRGDTSCEESLPMVCLTRNYPAYPANTNTAKFDIHWAQSTLNITGNIKGSLLTSETRANEICEDLFGAGSHMAEFHDAVNFTAMGDGGFFWAKGVAPKNTRFWVSIFDQPANPWDSVGVRPAARRVATGGTLIDAPLENSSYQQGNMIDTPQEGLAPGRPGCRGTTWTLHKQYANGLALVGSDARTNPYVGDTNCFQSNHVLCINIVGHEPPAASNGNDYGHNWSSAAIQSTEATYTGIDISSRRTVNNICREEFGNGYRMATYHDGVFGTSGNGASQFWGYAGGLQTGQRYWIAINDQLANPWNPRQP